MRIRYEAKPVIWPDGWKGHLGTERDPEAYIVHLVALFSQVRRVLDPRGITWLSLTESFQGRWSAGIPWRTALAMVEDGWRLRQELIWHRTNAPRDDTPDRFRRTHEQLFMFVKSARYRFKSNTQSYGTVWPIEIPRSFPGSTFFNSPEELVRRCLGTSALRKGAVVLDPFAGSGTVLSVAAREGFNALGVEVDSHELAVATKRLKDIAGLRVVRPS